MNEGAPIMYHGNGGFDGPGIYMIPGHVDRHSHRHYPLEVVQVMGGLGPRGGSAPGHGTSRRWQPRKDRQPNKTDNTAFGYDSDDSSLSSNASGSHKSNEKGKLFFSLINAKYYC